MDFTRSVGNIEYRRVRVHHHEAFEALRTTSGYMATTPTTALCKMDTQPSQTCSEVYTFPATVLYRGVSLYLGGI